MAFIHLGRLSKTVRSVFLGILDLSFRSNDVGREDLVCSLLRKVFYQVDVLLSKNSEISRAIYGMHGINFKNTHFLYDNEASLLNTANKLVSEAEKKTEFLEEIKKNLEV